MLEAKTRASLLRVTSYEVDVDLTHSGDTFRVTTRVSFDCHRPGESTFIDFRPSQVHSIRLNGRDLPTNVTSTHIALPHLEAHNELEIVADVRFVTTGDGLHKYVDPLDNKTYIGAYLGMDYCHRVFACFDQPDLKAPITLTVTAPADWSVRANGKPLNNTDGHWSFATTPPISTYGFALVAGPWHIIEREHAGITFGMLARASLSEFLDAQADDLFATTTACFDLYSTMFTEPYAFDSYDSAFVPELNWGAMESPGCVTFRDEYIFRTAVTDEERHHVDMVIAHEMAHMWFGNLATLTWWDTTWLNESFAEFIAYYVLDRIGGYGDPWATNTATGGWGTDADERPSTHPVAPRAEDVVDAERALDNFDGISYAKGARVLRQLMTWLGEDVFLRGINDYLTRFRFSNATLDDLLSSMSRASEQDVYAWADVWLQTTGIDTVRVLQTEDGLAIENTGSRPHVMYVSQFRADESGLTQVQRDGVAIDPHATTLLTEAAVPTAGALLTIPNDDDAAYVKIRVTPDAQQQVAQNLSAIPAARTRAVLWMMLRDQVRSAELDPLDYLSIVRTQLLDESNISIVDNVLRFCTQRVTAYYLEGAKRDEGLALVRATSHELMERHGNDSAGIGLAAARTLIAASRSADHVSHLKALLEKSETGGIPMSQDLRWRTFLALAILGGISDADIAAEVARDTSGLSNYEAPKVRAALPDLASKQRAWQIFVGEPDASAYVVTATGEGFWQPEHAEVLEQFRVRYFDEASTATLRRGPSMARALGYVGFPLVLVNGDSIEQVQRRLAADEVAPDLRRAWIDVSDDLRRALQVLAAQG